MRGARLAVLLAISVACGAQRPASDAAAAREVLSQIRSQDLAVRATGQRRLSASPRLLRVAGVAEALADVLTHDSAVFRADYLRSQPAPEELAELNVELSDIMLKGYGFRNPYVSRAQILGAYVPMSRFSLFVATEGGRVLADVRALARDSISARRAQAIGIFGYMLMRRREGRLKFPISAAQAAAIHEQLRAFARTGDSVERYTAVQALGFGGDAGDLPLLRHVAATDPSCAQSPKGMTVCWQALQAIKKIEARAKPRPRGVR